MILPPTLSKTGRALDRLANVTLVTAAVALMTIYGAAAFRASHMTTPVEDALKSIPGLDYSNADLTVMFVLSSSCAYCTESMPSIREITEAVRRTSGRIRVVAIGPEAESSLAAYINAHHLVMDGVHPVSLSALSELAPRVVLVDRDGRLRREWLGRLSATEAQAVIGALEPDTKRHY